MNIDNLDKKNIYKTPEHFFDEMQNNVLKETIGAKIIPIAEPKSRPKTQLWWYAAAVVLLAGLGLFFTLETEKNSVEMAKNQFEIKPEIISDANTYAQTSTTDENIEPKTKIIENPSALEMPNRAVVSQQTEPKPNIPSNKGNIKATEELMASLSSEDLSELYRNTEHDTYLDLYY